MGRARKVALLRGIHIGGRRSVPMAEPRVLATDLGWADPTTYVQSGNLLFAASGSTAALERALSQGLAARFGFEVPVSVVPADRWRKLAAGFPFDDAARERPKLLHLGLASRRVRAGVAAGIEAYGTGGERVAVRDGALWIDYPSGAARSKVTSDRIDRLVGAPVTLRNRRTVQAIAKRLREPVKPSQQVLRPRLSGTVGPSPGGAGAHRLGFHPRL